MRKRKLSSQIELQQMICPSCGHNVTQFSPFKPVVICPFCHQKSLNPLISKKIVRLPDRIIPHSTTNSDFGEHIINCLIKKDYTPIDIFDQISFDTVKLAYLPMYLYEGKFVSTWTCEAGYYKYEGRGKKRRRVLRYKPWRGVTKGNFSFLCLAYEGDDLPEKLVNFTQSFKYDKDQSTEYDPELIGFNDEHDYDILTLEINCDADASWGRSGEDTFFEIAEKKSERQAPSINRNFNASVQYDFSDYGTYVMVPFWFVYYFYKDNKYHFIMDGLGESSDFSSPKCSEISNSYKMIFSIATIIAAIVGVISAKYFNEVVFFFSTISVFLVGYCSRCLLSHKYYNLRLQAAKKAFPECDIFNEL